MHWDEIRSNGDQDCFGEILDEVQVCTFTRDPGTFGNSCWCHSDPEIWSPRENRKGLELFASAFLFFFLFFFCVWCGYLRLISCYHQFSKLWDLMLVADILEPGKNIFKTRSNTTCLREKKKKMVCCHKNVKLKYN